MADNPTRQHGRTQFFIEGEGFVDAALIPPRLRETAPAAVQGLQAAAATGRPTPERAFRFCRLFPKLKPLETEDAKLIALGQALDDPFVQGAVDSTIPAGFTYLGQFVDHDITFDRTQGETPDSIPSGQLKVEEIESARTPALELDSLYGRGPANSPELYEQDGVRLKIGTTFGRPDLGVTKDFPNDLLRRPADVAEKPRQAIIGDPRNDENLIVAQTHLAFLKFHNKIVEHLKGKGVKDKLFDEARKMVVQHYQSIVLFDFVARLADPAVFEDVFTKGRKYFYPPGAKKIYEKTEHVCMPVEFSGAAYRLGHSMIRNRYQWNKVFNSAGPAAPLFGGGGPTLAAFFEFSEVSGQFPFGPPGVNGLNPRLPSDWIADWRRMYDFSERENGVRHPQLNFARPIDTKLAKDLQTLPQFRNLMPVEQQSLAVRNLLRGRLLSLPSGQDVANHLGVAALTPSEVASEPHAVLLQSLGFDKSTPLWFYILKEAEVQQRGQRLGQVGSRLVVETFHGLVATSDHSILAEKGWKPSLPAQDADHYTMLDLLLFVDDINPLGD